MKLEYGIKMDQEQKLHFTQNMQQSVKLLQMPINDLREYINNQYSENPIIEMKEPHLNNDNSVDSDEKYSKLVKDIYENNYTERKNGNYYDCDEEKSPLNLIVNKMSLTDFLNDQVIELDIDEYNKNLCSYIISSLSSSGYLDIHVQEIAYELNVPQEDVEEALKIVQDLEPYGIGARDIRECLLIQIEKFNIKDEKLIEIIENYLEKIADNKYEFIAKKLNISAKKVQEYGDIIKKLEPKPSRGFYTGEEVKYIIPDAEIKNINGEYFIVMNEGAIPSVSINTVYKNIMQNNDESDAKEYVKEKMKQAIFLIKAIEQRKNTLYKVLECLIVKQREFFDKGRGYIKSLTLKEVAEYIDMHESTVSRAVKDKYILTGFGTIKIKDLFVNKAAASGDNDMASIKVKEKIKEIINKEDKTKPISDQKISLMMEEENIKVSRRTIAKYREELGIKGSAMRKRL